MDHFACEELTVSLRINKSVLNKIIVIIRAIKHVSYVTVSQMCLIGVGAELCWKVQWEKKLFIPSLIL